jgi:hypothetical protein
VKTYAGLVSRREYGNCEIEVKAESEKEAEEKILEVAGDYEFRCHDAEYVLDWVKEKETGTNGNGIRVVPYKRRSFAVYDGDELVCVTLYKKGANEVKRRLEDLGKEVNPNEVPEAVGVSDVESGGGQIQRGL